MLTLDSVVQQRHQRQAVLERTRDVTRTALLRMLEEERDEFADDAGRPVTSLSAQAGKPLMHVQFVEKLRRINSNFLYEQSISFPDRGGIYMFQRQPDGAYRKTFLCGCGYGWMPEFTIRRFKKEMVPDHKIQGGWLERKIPDEPTMGWRTVVARLLRGRYISEGEVTKAFPNLMPSRKWQTLCT